jgi:hypothetical protein
MFIEMWIIVTTIIVIVLLVIAVAILFFYKKAPDGFEDSEGFHTYQDAYEKLKQENEALNGITVEMVKAIAKSFFAEEYKRLITNNEVLKNKLAGMEEKLARLDGLVEKAKEDFSYLQNPEPIKHEGVYLDKKPLAFMVGLPEASEASEKLNNITVVKSTDEIQTC